MEEMDILQYFNENTSKEEWEVIQKVYTRELSDLLKELGMVGKETFNLAEVIAIYIGCALKKDLAHVETVDQEIGRATNESVKELFMEAMTETLEEYEAEPNKDEENNG